MALPHCHQCVPHDARGPKAPGIADGRVDVIARRVGDVLEIAVRDTGIGIAPADQEVVFEAFRQVGRHYTNKQEGTGLGLTLTRRFVELHGGRLRLESALGKGSTFTFSIPYRT